MAAGFYFLVSRGHAPETVWQYSIRQLNAMIRLAGKRDREIQAEMAWCSRIAYHANGKDFSQAIKDLHQDKD